jgi:excisionase family DNA binding protein
MNTEKEILILTISEACKTLRISKSSIYRLFRQRKLKSIQLGKRRLVRSEELLRFVKAAESR